MEKQRHGFRILITGLIICIISGLTGNGIAQSTVQTEKTGKNNSGLALFLSPDSIEVLFYAPLHARPDSNSAIIGFAPENSHFPVLKREQSWVAISFQEDTGWVKVRKILQATSPQKVTQHPSQDKTESFFTSPSLSLVDPRVLWMIIAALALGFIISILWAMNLYRQRPTNLRAVFNQTKPGKKPSKRFLPKQIKATKAIAQKDPLLVSPLQSVPPPTRRALFLALQDKKIESSWGGTKLTIGRCFTDLGFLVQQARNATALEHFLSLAKPQVLAIDFSSVPEAFSLVRQVLKKMQYWEGILFFYNVPEKKQGEAAGIFQQSPMLGTKITDRDVFQLLLPLLETETSDASNPINQNDRRPMLEGKITGESMADILQFLETGRKTGLLNVDTGSPYGLIYFQNGMIKMAQTVDSTAIEAVYQLLSLEAGYFQFLDNKEIKKGNCQLVPTEVLLQWARMKDESLFAENNGAND